MMLLTTLRPRRRALALRLSITTRDSSLTGGGGSFKSRAAFRASPAGPQEGVGFSSFGDPDQNGLFSEMPPLALICT
jgi:hypothetical protein